MMLDQLFEVCSDVSWPIFFHLTNEDVYSLEKVSRAIASLVNYHIGEGAKRGDARWRYHKVHLDSLKDNFDLTLGRVTLKPAQYVLAQKVLESTKTIDSKGSRFHNAIVNVVQAPMGFGKTILGIAIASLSPHRYLILVPAKALETWITELVRVFGDEAILKKDPASSPVLVAYRSNYPLHYTAMVENSFTDVNKIILTTTSSWSILDRRRPFRALDNTRVIIDEIETTKVMSHIRTKWVCGLSANHDPFQDWRYFTVNPAEVNEINPEVDTRYWLFPSSYTTIRIDMRSSMFEEELHHYIRLLGEIISDDKNGVKTAVFCPAGGSFDLFLTTVRSFVRNMGRELFVFRKSLGALTSFKECTGRALLLISEKNSEAINVVADSIVVIRPEWVGFKRLQQIVGRVVRPINEKVVIHYVTSKGYGKFRAFSAEMMRLVNVDGVVPAPSIDSWRNARTLISLLSMLGCDHMTLSPYDFLTVFYPSIRIDKQAPESEIVKRLLAMRGAI